MLEGLWKTCQEEIKKRKRNPDTEPVNRGKKYSVGCHFLCIPRGRKQGKLEEHFSKKRKEKGRLGKILTRDRTTYLDCVGRGGVESTCERDRKKSIKGKKEIPSSMRQAKRQVLQIFAKG